MSANSHLMDQTYLMKAFFSSEGLITNQTYCDFCDRYYSAFVECGSLLWYENRNCRILYRRRRETGLALSFVLRRPRRRRLLDRVLRMQRPILQNVRRNCRHLPLDVSSLCVCCIVKTFEFKCKKFWVQVDGGKSESRHMAREEWLLSLLALLMLKLFLKWSF